MVQTGLTERFSSAVAAVSNGLRSADENIAVAVSGGPDSLALLWLARAAFGTQATALTVDHGLRPGATNEAALVASRCETIGVAHTTLAWLGPKPAGNLQAAARDARYALMANWCAANGVRWLLTAHHADDQAETLLLRLARGSGSAGLAGIRARRELGSGVTLLRPLLDWRRSELAAIVAAAGWTAVDDPSNRATRFDRTQARALLAATPWLRPERLAAAAAHLAEAEAALAWTAELAWSSRVEVSGPTVFVDAAGLPSELQRRLLMRVIATVAPEARVSGPSLERWRRLLAAGRSATLAGVAGSSGPGCYGKASAYPVWRFALAAPRR